MNIKKRKWHSLIIVIGSLIMMWCFEVCADTSSVLPTNTVQEKLVAVDLPVVRSMEDSPYNFKLDPMKLIYATDAEKYGGGSVEEEATMLFHNSGGTYDYSSSSDKLTVRNRSTVPVKLSVIAIVGNPDHIKLLTENKYDDDDTCSMYMALVDDEGHEVPISQDGIAKIEFMLEAAPENAYVYKYNEQSDNYDYVLSKEESQIEWPTYSFGLKGSCNPNGDWSEIKNAPFVEVKWEMEEAETEGNDDSISSENTETVSGNETNTDDSVTSPETSTTPDMEIVYDSETNEVTNNIVDEGNTTNNNEMVSNNRTLSGNDSLSSNNGDIPKGE